MKKQLNKLFALVLCLCMLAALLTGCAGKPAEAPTESEAPVESTAPAENAPATQTVPEEQIPDVESVDVGDSKYAVSYIDSGIQYPLTDEPVTLTYYTSTMDNLLMKIETYNDHKLMPAITEATGVKLDFVESSMTSYSEQFNLIIAGGEYYDFMDCSNYAGSFPKAYTDEIIFDLTDILDEWGKNFLHAAETAGSTLKDITTDDGLRLYMCTLNDLYQPISGISVRQDWLDEQGVEAPETLDELYDFCKNMKAAYDCTGTFGLDNDGIMYDVFGAFGINAVAFKVNQMMPGSIGSEIGAFQKDGKVYCSLLMDEYREYLEYQKKFYDEGLLDKDFYSAVFNPNDNAARYANGYAAIFRCNADEYSSIEDLSEDGSVQMAGVKPIVKNAGDVYKFGEKASYVGIHKASVTTDCEYPELAVGFLNWFYTEEGSIFGSYGTLDESYTLDAEGDPQLTDLVLHNPDGMGTSLASMYYTFGLVPTYLVRERLWPGYLQKELDALNLWTQTVNAEYTMPSISMTTDESNRYSSLASDIYTYSSEMLLKFVVGEEALDDNSWADFQNTIKELGAEECVSICQDALDRYNSR